MSPKTLGLVRAAPFMHRLMIEYWLDQLARLPGRPDRVEWTMTEIPDLERVMHADIQALALRYLTRETAWRATAAHAQP